MLNQKLIFLLLLLVPLMSAHAQTAKQGTTSKSTQSLGENASTAEIIRNVNYLSGLIDLSNRKTDALAKLVNALAEKEQADTKVSSASQKRVGDDSETRFDELELEVRRLKSEVQNLQRFKQDVCSAAPAIPAC